MKQINLPKRILLVQTAFIGDVILITPLIRALKELYPDSVIDCMVVPGTASLLANNPYLSDVIQYDKHGKSSIFNNIKTLKAAGYDMAISPHSSFRTHLILFLSRIPRRLGYARGFLNSYLLTDGVPHPKGIHKIQKNLSLLKPLTNRSFSMQTDLFPSETDIEAAKLLLDELGHQEKPRVAMAPGSIWNTKCWPLEYYKKLALMLLKHKCSIVLIGSKDDFGKCSEIETHCKNSVPDAAIINTAGRSGLLCSAELIGKSEFLVCNDSGALHIANAMKTKVFAFFGPTVQRIGYYPFREGDKVFEIELDCRPCGSHGSYKCPLGHHNCMRRLLPEQILPSLLEQLKAEL